MKSWIRKMVKNPAKPIRVVMIVLPKTTTRTVANLRQLQTMTLMLTTIYVLDCYSENESTEESDENFVEPEWESSTEVSS